MQTPADDPNYDGAASSVSKTTIFTVLASGYLFFFSGVVPSVFSVSGVLGFLLGGGAFVFIGMFAVSILISIPLFLLRAQVPALSILMSIANVAATIFATRFVYLWLFASPEAAAMSRCRCLPSATTRTLPTKRCELCAPASSPLLRLRAERLQVTSREAVHPRSKTR